MPCEVVDRPAFMTECAARLLDGQHVMTPGPRGIGKSSGARRILQRLRARGFITVSVDLFYIASVEELAVKILKFVLQIEPTGTHGTPAEAWQESRPQSDRPGFPVPRSLTPLPKFVISRPVSSP